jgi:antitoxin-like ribbon-helix-helix protein
MPARVKRTSLESLAELRESKQPTFAVSSEPTTGKARRPRVKQQTAYLPLAVYRQLRELAFVEERKMHDYLLQGLDMVFHQKGLKSIAELTGKQE